MDFLRKFKDAEIEHRSYLPAKRWVVLRLDGKAFHTYTAGLERPFDALFMAAMDKTTQELCAALSGAVVGYVQSDEISVIIDTMTKAGIQPTMSGQIQKLTSISAAMATGHFNRVRWAQGFADSFGVFDSRIALATDDLEDVHDYISWRRGDAAKNSVSMAAESRFGHKTLLGKNSVERKEMLRDINQPWENLPAGFRYGRLVHRYLFTEDVTFTNKKTKQQQTVEATRSCWRVVEADAEWLHLVGKRRLGPEPDIETFAKSIVAHYEERKLRKTMLITISGGSDDLIEIDGCEGADEFCNSKDGLVKLAGNFIAPDGSGMRVYAMYDGTWSFALGLIDEDHEWAGWPVSIEQGDRAYNTSVRVEAPEGTRFVLDDKFHFAR